MIYELYQINGIWNGLGIHNYSIERCQRRKASDDELSGIFGKGIIYVASSYHKHMEQCALDVPITSGLPLTFIASTFGHQLYKASISDQAFRRLFRNDTCLSCIIGSSDPRGGIKGIAFEDRTSRSKLCHTKLERDLKHAVCDSLSVRSGCRTNVCPIIARIPIEVD